MEKELDVFFDRLWPICRSITGNGLRESFNILQEIIPLELEEIPTGTNVFDWKIPKEWNISEAYIITPKGDKICDLKVNNLHVVNYSTPIETEVSFLELEAHLHYREDIPDAIPYVTSYYKENWGFCISYNDFKKLPTEGQYSVVIKSSLENGSLTYGHVVLPGSSEKEVLFSSYLCHPSMANNELSGPLVLAFLYNEISKIKDRKYTYRFVLAPETIGIIAYLSKYGTHLKTSVEAGYVLTCCGDEGDFTFKMSKYENSLADRIAKHVLKYQEIEYEIVPFSVGGSDERQYCSPGFNLPVASLTRSMYKKYKEYHTSLDNKELISFSAMKKTVETYLSFVKAIELNDCYQTTVPYCEPFMQQHNLYSSFGGTNSAEQREFQHRRMHLLTFSDGKTDLIEIADRRNESILKYVDSVAELKNAGLLR